MDEKEKEYVKQRLVEVINLSKKDPLVEKKIWEEYNAICQQYDSLGLEFRILMKNFSVITDTPQMAKINNDKIRCWVQLVNKQNTALDGRRDCIIELLKRTNYEVSTNNAFFHIKDCNFYTLSPFLNKDPNSNHITLIKTISMEPVTLEFQKRDDTYQFYERTTHNELVEAPLYSFTELGLEEQMITTNQLYLMEKHYGKQLKKQ